MADINARHCLVQTSHAQLCGVFTHTHAHTHTHTHTHTRTHAHIRTHTHTHTHTYTHIHTHTHAHTHTHTHTHTHIGVCCLSTCNVYVARVCIAYSCSYVHMHNIYISCVLQEHPTKFHYLYDLLFYTPGILVRVCIGVLIRCL